MARLLEQTIAAELRIDETEAGFSSFGTTAGPQDPGTRADDAAVGSIAWSSIANIATDNGVGATASLGSTATVSTTETQGAGSGTSADFFGSPITWSNPSRITASDSSPATANFSGTENTDYLVSGGHGFSIPTNATINGIEVNVRRRRASGSDVITDIALVLLQGGVPGGTNNADTATGWGLSYATVTYGGASNLWGRSWTPAQINASDFGVAFAVSLPFDIGGGAPEVDYISIKVYYSYPTYSTETSHYAKATYGFAVPASTIRGITVVVKRRKLFSIGNYVRDSRVRLVKAGTVQSVDKAATSTNWPSSYATRTYGGSSDLWAGSWTPTDVNNSGFGVVVSAVGLADSGGDAIADIDSIQVSVTYEVAGVATTVTGAAPVRFSPDETDAGNVPQSVGFQTEIPGGFSSAEMTVARSEFFDPDKLVYASARLYSYEDNRTLYEGRVVGISDSGESVTFEMEGMAAHLEDDHSARMIWYDRDLSSWGGMSVQRKLNQLAAGNPFEGSAAADSTTGASALQIALELPWTVKGLGEAWYDAQGLSIGFVDYAWKIASTTAFASASFSWTVKASSDDILTASNTTAELRAAGPGSGTLTTTAGKTFAMVQFQFNAAATGSTAAPMIFWTLLGVVGDHGLTLQGAVAAPGTGRGLYATDIIEHCVETWAPLLTIGEIEASDFAIPHAVDKEPTTAREMIEKYVLFGGGTSDYPIDWWVYENRTFGAGTSGNYGKVWRTRYDPDGAEAAESGPDVQRMINGCILTYNDGVGDRSVGPPGSDADFETTDLIDVTPDNPANRTGAQHWELFNAGVTTQGGAVQIGKMIMAERNRQEWRGEVRIKEWVIDENGHEYPAAMVRAGDRLVIEDDEDTRERRIVQTSYDSDSETVSCSIGASPDRLDTLLARLSVVLEGRLS